MPVFYLFIFILFMTKSWDWLLNLMTSAQQETVAKKSDLEREGLRFLMSLNLSVSEMDSLPIKGMMNLPYCHLCSLLDYKFLVFFVIELSRIHIYPLSVL